MPHWTMSTSRRGITKEREDSSTIRKMAAVVTEGYARAIGADYYAKDVRDAVKITGKVFGK